MFEKYKEKARRTIFFARYEASQYGSPYIEVAHLLLGLARQSFPTFEMLGVERAALQHAVEALCVQGKAPTSTSVDLPLSHVCQRVLNYAAEEAESLSHGYIGPDHLLLGVLRENGPEARALGSLGLELEAVREVFLLPIAANLVSQIPPQPASREFVEKLLAKVPDERLAVAAQLLAGLSREVFMVSGITSAGRFTYSFRKKPPAAP